MMRILGSGIWLGDNLHAFGVTGKRKSAVASAGRFDVAHHRRAEPAPLNPGGNLRS